MTKAEIKQTVDDFVASAKRAERIGYDLIELHGGHGYLLHQFLSPLSNQRKDEYGGSLENRMRFPLEIFSAVRAVWPKDKPIGIRISAVDWVDGGTTIEDTVVLAKELKKLGCDYMDVSSGQLDARQKIPFAPGFNLQFAERVKKDMRHHHHVRRPDPRGQTGRGSRRIRQDRFRLHGARRDVGSALCLACRRGARGRDAISPAQRAGASQHAADAVPEPAEAGGVIVICRSSS